jgi:hypothetical protein
MFPTDIMLTNVPVEPTGVVVVIISNFKAVSSFYLPTHDSGPDNQLSHQMSHQSH